MPDGHTSPHRVTWHLRLRRWIAWRIVHALLPDSHGVYWPADYAAPDESAIPPLTEWDEI